jgi:hypothetical protein
MATATHMFASSPPAGSALIVLGTWAIRPTAPGTPAPSTGDATAPTVDGGHGAGNDA